MVLTAAGLAKSVECSTAEREVAGRTNIREIKAPFTRQKIFGAAWMKVVRVPKKITDYSFTRSLYYRAKRCEFMIWYG